MPKENTLRLKSPQLYQLSYRPKSLQGQHNTESCAAGVRVGVPAVYPVVHREDNTTTFPAGAVVELVSGDSKGFRGVVLGQARSSYRGVPDVELRMENGDVRWVRPDFCRRVDGGGR